MNHRVRIAVCAVMALVSIPAASGAEHEDDFVPLFDGRTLKGWEGNEKWFRVESGAIVAGHTDRRIPRNYFLTTKEKYRNFELRLKVRLSRPGANSGIQFRSRRHGEDVIGYQADAGKKWWGKLYDEHRRRKVLAGPDDETIADILKPGRWNDYRIRCRGNHVQLWLNGHKTVDYAEPDEDIAETGVIGLQIHSGPAAEAHFKDIRIRTFDK